MAIFSLNHRPISKKKSPGLASNHLRYITRDSAQPVILSGRIPTDPKQARAWISNQVGNDEGGIASQKARLFSRPHRARGCAESAEQAGGKSARGSYTHIARYQPPTTDHQPPTVSCAYLPGVVVFVFFMTEVPKAAVALMKSLLLCAKYLSALIFSSSCSMVMSASAFSPRAMA